jgi:hypothetical protein
MFFVMTSNLKGSASYDKTPEDEEKKTFTELLRLIWSKIYERFPNINAAFRFFDSNYDQAISFNEFA